MTAALALRLALAAAPSEYAVETIPLPADLVPEIGAIAFCDATRLWVGSRRGLVWRVTLPPAPGARLARWDLFARGLHEVTGLLAGADEREVIVAERPALTRARDQDGDGRAELYDSLSEEWGLSGNYHEYTFGPVADGAGGFFVGLGCASDAAGVFPILRGELSPVGRVGRMYSAVPWRGWILHVAADGTTTPWANGLREPNGMGLSPAGELFVTDNQGDWLGTSALHRVVRGGFHGHAISRVWEPGFAGDPLALPVEELDRARVKPVIEFPHGRCCSSPTQPAWFPDGGRFGPFDGQIVVGDIPAARLLRVALEQVDGAWQGAVIPFLERAGLRTGCNRLAFAPDGASLWIGQGSRGWAEGEGLQRVVWNGVEPFAIARVRARPGGFALELTAPVDPASIAGPAVLSVQHWRYLYHRPYGSPEVDLVVEAGARLAAGADARTLEIALPELHEDKIYELALRGVKCRDGRALEGDVAWYTVRRAPR